jgi:hypothetical protein
LNRESTVISHFTYLKINQFLLINELYFKYLIISLIQTADSP